MVVQTGRFGQIEISTDEIITIPSGILGFPEEQDTVWLIPEMTRSSSGFSL